MNPTGAATFIARLLHGVTAIHMHHLMVMGQGAYAKHMALGELYAALQEHVDGLAEEVIGAYNVSLPFAGGAFTLTENPIAEVQALYDFVIAGRSALGPKSHVQNSVDGVSTVLAHALYKLRRLQ